MVVKFRPDGRVYMVFGRKKEASDEDTGPAEASEPAAAGGRQPIPPADRRRLRLGRQRLYQRRLHQFARRQDRQGRLLGQVLGRSRHRPGPVQHRRTASASTPTGQHLCRRPQQSPHPGLRRRRQFPAPDHHRRAGAARRFDDHRQQAGRSDGGERAAAVEAGRALGDLHHARRRISSSTPPTPSPAASTS